MQQNEPCLCYMACLTVKLYVLVQTIMLLLGGSATRPRLHEALHCQAHGHLGAVQGAFKAATRADYQYAAVLQY